ncbi:MAG: ThiF family adenylyltransferase [Candidatus Omnitrophica bacterium]|nr:ThiF family adenylyltransferase [Candidatus Omnitrophota bacterium]
MQYSVALTHSLHKEATKHLLRPDGQEDLCFALWYPSRGNERFTALLHRLILPGEEDRLVRGNVSFLPSYFERAVVEAIRANAGLAFLHSHPRVGWQGMSRDDIKAETGIAPSSKGATGFPLVGLTLGADGSWSARFWVKLKPKKYKRHWCSNVRIVGSQLAITHADHLNPAPRFKKELARTISAWGEKKQADLARLRIGIVGAGSVGSIVAETFARMGIKRITLIDFDRVEHINLDRLLHATRIDAFLRRPKVSVLARALRKSATAEKFRVDQLQRSVYEKEGYRAALDCDVLFSCVDRPLGRSVLNFIAYAHLIPVVDGGVRVETTKSGKLKRADWKAHIASPERRCLECLDQYDPGLVSADKEGYFDDPKYIQGLADNSLKQNENVFAFGLNVASLEVLQLLMMVIVPLGISDAGAQLYHFVPGKLDVSDMNKCDENCFYPGLIARGDCTGIKVTGQHKHK